MRMRYNARNFSGTRGGMRRRRSTRGGNHLSRRPEFSRGRWNRDRFHYNRRLNNARATQAVNPEELRAQAYERTQPTTSARGNPAGASGVSASFNGGSSAQSVPQARRGGGHRLSKYGRSHRARAASHALNPEELRAQLDRELAEYMSQPREDDNVNRAPTTNARENTANKEALPHSSNNGAGASIQ